jgi:hypothetical protein
MPSFSAWSDRLGCGEREVLARWPFLQVPVGSAADDVLDCRASPLPSK